MALHRGRLFVLLAAATFIVSMATGSPLHYSSEKKIGEFRAFVDKLKTRIESVALPPHHHHNDREGSSDDWTSSHHHHHHHQHGHMTCDSCKLMVEAVRLALDVGMAENKVEKMVIDMCEWVDVFDHRVCVGIVYTFKDEVLHIVDHLALSPGEICGVLMGDKCGKPYWPFSPWNVTLPQTPKPPVAPHVLPKSGSPTLRVLHLTDIHLDNLYTPGTNAMCPEPMCCRAYDGRPKPDEKGAGMYGDYRDCDTPSWTLEGLFEHLSKQKFDYILWTGDLPAHNVWNQTKADQLGLLYSLTDLMNRYFPTTPIYPSVGNHESSPVNSFPPRYIKGQYSIGWLYDALASAWKTWLPEDALQSVRKVGYYTISPYPGFRVISLNTNMCDEWNWWLFLNTTDPDGQLAWLIETLQKAEDSKEKVHIIGHIPPGIVNCLKYWSYNYYLIVDRYESTITGQFFGHTHFDQFEVFYDAKTLKRPTNVAYISPSVTPYSFLNMGYRVFTFDGNHTKSSWEVLDHETYILNLTAANSLLKPPVWELEYSAKADLGMASLFPEDWNELITRAKNDNALLQKLYRFYYKSYVDAPCERYCGEVLLCGMRSARSYSNDVFCPHLSMKEMAKHPLLAQKC